MSEGSREGEREWGGSEGGIKGRREGEIERIRGLERVECGDNT
jgi:hypothetical protein